jgi:hypothetical protein
MRFMTSLRPSRAIRQRWVGAACVLVSSLWMLAVPARAASLVRIPVQFRVAQVDGAPVASDAFLAQQLAQANEIYRPLGIELVDVKRGILGKAHARMLSRDDRDRLGEYLAKEVINCMIVATLMDVDEPGRERRGVHWTHRTQRDRHYVIVSAISGPYVLAHELGHFFGNREHSDTPGNLMSYQRTDAPPFLDEAQQKRVRDTLERMLSSGELKPK